MSFPQVHSSNDLLRYPVRNVQGEDLGTLRDLMVDLRTGRVNYVLIAAGGFLGLGEKEFMIPWDAVAVDAEQGVILLNVSRERLEKAPAYDRENPPDLTDEQWHTGTYAYYGYQAAWAAPS